MATDNYDSALNRVAAVRALRNHLDDLHSGDRARPAEIAKASKGIDDALKIGQINGLLAIADSVDRLTDALTNQP